MADDFKSRTTLPLPDKKQIELWFELLGRRFPQLSIGNAKRPLSKLKGVSFSELEDLAQDVLRRCVLETQATPQHVFAEQIRVWVKNQATKDARYGNASDSHLSNFRNRRPRTKKGGGETEVRPTKPNAPGRPVRAANSADSNRRSLSEMAPSKPRLKGAEPEKVLVLETAGSVSDFINAVRRIEGMEWLAEIDEELAADEDFYRPGRTEEVLAGRPLLGHVESRCSGRNAASLGRISSQSRAEFDLRVRQMATDFSKTPGVASVGRRRQTARNRTPRKLGVRYCERQD